ncbi:hypothetical protein BH11MYX4_BH11MYX4_17010 [soil metagenome]
MKRSSSLVVALAIGIAACSPKEDAQNNGVDDVKAACQIRAGWPNAEADKCKNCLASAAQPACDCELFKEFGGKCHSQNVARQSEPDCTDPVLDCTYKCPKNDCACLDACYATAAKCKSAAAAVDGCVTDVCAPYCK